MFTKGRKLHDFASPAGSHAEWVAGVVKKMDAEMPGAHRFMAYIISVRLCLNSLQVNSQDTCNLDIFSATVKYTL